MAKVCRKTYENKGRFTLHVIKRYHFSSNILIDMYGHSSSWRLHHFNTCTSSQNVPQYFKTRLYL